MCIRESEKGEPWGDPTSMAKGDILSMIGLCNRATCRTWFSTMSDHSDDHTGPVELKRRLRGNDSDDEGALPEWEFLSKTEHKSLHGCLLPLGLIALCMERARMDWLHWRLSMEPGVRLHSCHIDEIVFERPKKPILSRRNPWVVIPTPELVTYKNGQPVYKFLDRKAPDAKKRTKDWRPSWEIEAPEPRRQLPELTATYQWRVVTEPPCRRRPPSSWSPRG